MTSRTTSEIISQPELWDRAAELARGVAGLPQPGENVAIIGCGTSWFMAQSYAVLREEAGQGQTDAFTASLLPVDRDYDRAILLSRSGTTTEIVDVAVALRERGTPSTLITAVGDGPVTPHVAEEIVLDFADEQSVVQTRFATTALSLLRASTGQDLSRSVADARAALDTEIPAEWVEASQVSFLGEGWCYGLANEAALKWREASQAWTEAYPAMEYRHGPIAIAEPGRLTWVFGQAPAGMAEQVALTGATLLTFELDPLAVLVLAQRTAVARAHARGLDPDRPRHLSRAVILPGPQG
ncbi:MAG: SIS domain-containing protein [Actinomyces sp.]|uniref:SIS domain-containing protein n=1 Tax=Actinomyces sp. TaxID=29317 RepID=UPI0026DAA602|nr:SIS domain-containing protein [Actinomyces sp.]MDO4242639.1 SIS domain-containing protein [Actinomyces sp.]